MHAAMITITCVLKGTAVAAALAAVGYAVGRWTLRGYPDLVPSSQHKRANN